MAARKLSGAKLKAAEKADMAADKRAGIKEGSARDKAIDKSKGLPDRAAKGGRFGKQTRKR